jgi:hypothetical protein
MAAVSLLESSDMPAFIAAGKYLHHAQMASRKTRRMPGEAVGSRRWLRRSRY